MFSKLISIFFDKKPQSKKYFTVMREKNIVLDNNYEKSSKNSGNILFEKDKQTIKYFMDRGKIYNMLFSACSQR